MAHLCPALISPMGRTQGGRRREAGTPPPPLLPRSLISLGNAPPPQGPTASRIHVSFRSRCPKQLRFLLETAQVQQVGLTGVSLSARQVP